MCSCKVITLDTLITIADLFSFTAIYLILLILLLTFILTLIIILILLKCITIRSFSWKYVLFKLTLYISRAITISTNNIDSWNTTSQLSRPFPNYLSKMTCFHCKPLIFKVITRVSKLIIPHLCSNICLGYKIRIWMHSKIFSTSRSFIPFRMFHYTFCIHFYSPFLSRFSSFCTKFHIFCIVLSSICIMTL